MASNRKIKFALVAVFALVLAGWAMSGSFGTVRGDASADEFAAPAAVPDDNKDAGYVGSETCKACHEDQFNNFAHTKHGKLTDSPAWKGKVTGCETCHGPGQAHVEGGGDKTKIKTFANMSSKEISDSCLTCHAAKDTHNNFRRGEHWRNDISCTECHTPHGEPANDAAPGSMTFVGAARQDRNTQHPVAMLRQNEPQLCLSCHNEKKAEFSKPFHHKVQEGFMKCSDCHNAHGGFENKQTKLANGADAACIKCHSNKQGPFVFEHGPVKTEGCSACHSPHGSNNPKMLKRANVRQLCLECHTGIQGELAPQEPSLHSQPQVKYQQCTVCHSAIHGSNSSNVFFR